MGRGVALPPAAQLVGHRSQCGRAARHRAWLCDGSFASPPPCLRRFPAPSASPPGAGGHDRHHRRRVRHLHAPPHTPRAAGGKRRHVQGERADCGGHAGHPRLRRGAARRRRDTDLHRRDQRVAGQKAAAGGVLAAGHYRRRRGARRGGRPDGRAPFRGTREPPGAGAGPRVPARRRPAAPPAALRFAGFRGGLEHDGPPGPRGGCGRAS